MPVQKEEPLRLIIIDDSSNDAERVSSMLRNAGQPVRTLRVEDDEDLRAAINAQSWDLILAKPEIPYFNALDALTVVNRLERDIPVVVLLCENDTALVEEALSAGARDTVSLARPERLVHAILREVAALKQRRLLEEYRVRLQETETRAQSLVDSSRDAIAYVHDGMHIYANDPYLELFGCSDFAELEGLPMMDLVAHESQERFKELMKAYLSGKTRTGTAELRGRRPDGSEFDVALELSPAGYDGELCIQVVVRDQAAHKELEQQLDRLSKYDLLTGLANRQFFLEYLKRLFANPKRNGAVLSIEPDNFRAVREQAGIAGADVVLADIAGVVNRVLAGEGVVARFEDHIFAAILLGRDEQQSVAAAQRLLGAVEEHLSEVGGRTISVTCSVGIALFDETVGDPLQVLSRADKARAKAVAAGGHRLHCYNPVAEEMAEQERLGVWVRQLKQALRENRFRLLYQPIISLRGDTAENYEVLLRLLDDRNEDVAPAEFLAAAERSGLMVAVDRWVLAHTAKLLAERSKEGRKINLFVKISAASLKDPKFLPWLRDLIHGRQLQPESLTLEVAESVASSNLKALKILGEGLRQLRVRFALDHFNLAPNWAALLRHCNASFLKIDSNLIQEIQHKDNQAKVSELATQAREQGKMTIAQHVENASNLSTLWTCGVDYIQGYFLQGPEATMDYDFAAF